MNFKRLKGLQQRFATIKENDTVLEVIKNKGGDYSCPMCGSTYFEGVTKVTFGYQGDFLVVEEVDPYHDIEVFKCTNCEIEVEVL